MHLGDERARRVDGLELARVCIRVHLWSDAVRGQDESGTMRHLLFALHEDRPTLLEITHDVGVVNDLLADVDGRPA